jgi:hypothetical protein
MDKGKKKKLNRVAGQTALMVGIWDGPFSVDLLTGSSRFWTVPTPSKRVRVLVSVSSSHGFLDTTQPTWKYRGPSFGVSRAELCLQQLKMERGVALSFHSLHLAAEAPEVGGAITMGDIQ